MSTFTQQKSQQDSQSFPFDFFYSAQSQDILAPHPDSFEHDLDLSLAAEDPASFKLFSVDPNPAFTLVRSETPKCGPPSAFTVSSESAYDSLSISSQSESIFSSSFSQAPYSPPELSAFPALDMDFDRIRLHTMSDYGSMTHQSSFSAAEFEAAAEVAGFGLPPTPPYSPDSPPKFQDTFSDYGSSYSPVAPFAAPATVDPGNMTLSKPPTAPIPSSQVDDKVDPRKKYKCTICPRSFARAYNLKTHMATHDPNRLKPHVCHYPSCGRSFSRKHDLGRHLVSIHRQDVRGDASGKPHIGIQKGRRVWCDGCGKSSEGGIRCDCQDSEDSDK